MHRSSIKPSIKLFKKDMKKKKNAVCRLTVILVLVLEVLHSIQNNKKLWFASLLYFGKVYNNNFCITNSKDFIWKLFQKMKKMTKLSDKLG